MNMLLSLPQHLMGISLQMLWLLSEKWQKVMVEAHGRSAKHRWGSFHETESSQTFLKHAIPDFADKLLFVSFQRNEYIVLFSNTVCEYALHSVFPLKTQKIDTSR